MCIRDSAKDPSKVGCRWTGVTTMQALQSTEPAAGFFVQNESRSVVLVSSDFLRPAVGPNPNGPGAPMFDLAVTFPGQVPVSYTHLDVYKRQSVDGSTGSWTAPPAPGRGLEAVSLEGGQLPPLTWLALWSALALLVGVGAAIAYQAVRAAWRRRGVRPVEMSQATAPDWSQD